MCSRNAYKFTFILVETDFKYPDHDKRRPAVPKHTEKPLMGLNSTKNHITTNAVENIMSVPKKPEKKFADTRGGATHPLEPSGLTPKYVNKKDYGKTPAYLERRKAEVERAQMEYDAYVQERFRQGAMKNLTEEQRQDILDGLKKNWEELHHQYQGLSVVTDTAPKKARKERMEAEMKQLERDIETIEKHKVIYIANPFF
ncbi:enkurin-like [Orbicella faveolata]|uniref:enkurin-like n=1 Tax=Orbicella faveolata TaxID=48498 RepID=UPI0009E1D354|nr:enkurin-like [Orbicella faveolata]